MSEQPTRDPVLDRVLERLGLPMTASGQAGEPQAAEPPPSGAPLAVDHPVSRAASAKRIARKAARPVAHRLIARIGDLVERRAQRTEQELGAQIDELRAQVDDLRAELDAALQLLRAAERSRALRPH